MLVESTLQRPTGAALPINPEHGSADTPSYKHRRHELKDPRRNAAAEGIRNQLKTGMCRSGIVCALYARALLTLASRTAAVEAEAVQENRYSPNEYNYRRDQSVTRWSAFQGVAMAAILAGRGESNAVSCT